MEYKRCSFVGESEGPFGDLTGLAHAACPSLRTRALSESVKYVCIADVSLETIT